MEYTFEYRDEFNRKLTAEKLIKLLNSEIRVSPIIIDGSWGSGKSEFCKKLINLIITKDDLNFKPLYLNAYKYDNSDDPFLMLISGISSLIEKKEIKKDIITQAIPVLKVLGKIGGKATMNWILQQNINGINEDITKAISDHSGDVIERSIKKLFEDFEKVDDNLKLLKKSLGKITKEKKLIIFIDELDRCKPTFALSLLEKVKHVFDIQGVQFVFTTNMKQLCAIVRQQYGEQIDAEEYLSKFFYLKIQFSNITTQNKFNFKNNSFILFDNLLKPLPHFKRNWGYNSSASRMLKEFFENDERSLRDAEQYFKNLEVFNALEGEYTIKENNNKGYAILMMLGVYIYTFDTDFSNKILRYQYTKENIAKFFGKTYSVFGDPLTSNINEKLCALFIIDLPNDGYKELINEEKFQQWERNFSYLFEDHFYKPDRGDRIEIVRQTIRTMQFV